MSLCICTHRISVIILNLWFNFIKYPKHSSTHTNIKGSISKKTIEYNIMYSIIQYNEAVAGFNMLKKLHIILKHC